jgi:hypothetical protein
MSIMDRVQALRERQAKKIAEVETLKTALEHAKEQAREAGRKAREAENKKKRSSELRAKIHLGGLLILAGLDFRLSAGAVNSQGDTLDVDMIIGLLTEAKKSYDAASEEDRKQIAAAGAEVRARRAQDSVKSAAAQRIVFKKPMDAI